MVEAMYREFPDCRNEDPKLVGWLYWKFFQQYMFKDARGRWWIDAEALISKKIPNPDSLTRAGRKFREPSAKYPNGQYPASNRVTRGRRAKQEDFRFDMPSDHWKERIEDVR